MKKYLLLLILVFLMGCAGISYEPVTHPDHPDQRIQLTGFSFLPPNGKNWEMATDPIEKTLFWENWGRSTLKMKAFRKSIVGPTQKPEEAEKLLVNINKYEFAIFKFHHDDYLMEFNQIPYDTFDNRGLKLLELNSTNEKFSGMNCVRSKGKGEGGRKLSNSKASAVILYFQKYVCVHPRYSNHLIELITHQEVLKGQTPTDVQSEFDYFYNSLQVH